MTQTRVYLVASIGLSGLYALLNHVLGNSLAEFVMLASNAAVVLLYLASHLLPNREPGIRQLMLIAWVFAIGALPFCLGGLRSFATAWLTTLPILSLLTNDRSFVPALVLAIVASVLAMIVGYVSMIAPDIRFHAFPFDLNSPEFTIINTFYLASLIPTIAFFVYIFAAGQRKALAKVEDQRNIIESLNRNVRFIVDNIPQGIITINEKGHIDGDPSPFTFKILETTDLVGRDLLEVLFAEAGFGADQLAQFRSVIGMIGEDEFSFEANSAILPLEYTRTFPNGLRKNLRLEWHALIDGNHRVSKIMISLWDDSDLRRFQIKIQKQKDELEIFSLLQKNSPKVLQDFINDISALSRNLEAFFTQPVRADGDELQAIYRIVHTQKGLVRLVGLRQAADLIHDFEDRISLTRTGALTTDDLRAAYAGYAEALQGILDPLVKRYRTFYSQHHDLEQQFSSLVKDLESLRAQDNVPLSLRGELKKILLSSQSIAFRKLIEEVSVLFSSSLRGSDRPMPDIVFEGSDPVLAPSVRGSLKTCLLQLITNAIDHGLEPADVRTKSGKSTKGRILISCKPDASGVTILFQDDGRGLNLNRIWEKALANGLIDSDRLDDQAIAALIFTASLTTAERITESSGRGVGLDIVMSETRRIGAEIRIEFTGPRTGAFRPFRFALHLPQEALIGAEAQALSFAAQA